jgi:hypothetical protein
VTRDELDRSSLTRLLFGYEMTTFARVDFPVGLSHFREAAGVEERPCRALRQSAQRLILQARRSLQMPAGKSRGGLEYRFGGRGFSNPYQMRVIRERGKTGATLMQS